MGVLLLLFGPGTDARGVPVEPPDGVPWAAYASHIHDYMRRWIVRTPWGTLRVHRILRKDHDADPHDHPFDFVSVILRGGYAEERLWPDGTRTVRRYGRGSVLRRRAEDAHRFLTVDPETTTFVIAGPKRRSWGFHTPTGWVPWRVYVGP
jgi:hypothetical protein